jgi:hypothetical protein
MPMFSGPLLSSHERKEIMAANAAGCTSSSTSTVREDQGLQGPTVRPEEEV